MITAPIPMEDLLLYNHPLSSSFKEDKWVVFRLIRERRNTETIVKR